MPGFCLLCLQDKELSAGRPVWVQPPLTVVVGGCALAWWLHVLSVEGGLGRPGGGSGKAQA